jgi:hypothetical protein
LLKKQLKVIIIFISHFLKEAFAITAAPYENENLDTFPPSNGFSPSNCYHNKRARREKSDAGEKCKVIKREFAKAT